MLKRLAFPADSVETTNVGVEVWRRGEVAGTKLVLLAIQVFFATRLNRHVLEQLEAAVDAVHRRQRCREEESNPECVGPSRHQIFIQNVGRVDEQVAAEVFAHRGLRELGQILTQLFSRVAPCKVGIRLGEAELGEVLHPLGPREGLGEKHRLRMTALHVGNDPFPERHRLGVRIVHPESAHAVLDPEEKDVAAGRP